MAALLLLASCHSVEPGLRPATAAPPIRLMITFDDGPSIRNDYNPTLAIIRQLATNDVQPGIKAIFFVQTEHKKGGGTPQGRDIMRYAHEQGHVIGIHSTSTRGHIAHVTLPTDALIGELRQAMRVIERHTGSVPQFIRPPFGACDLRTRTIYTEVGLNMVMADIPARDGIIYGYNASPRRRSHLYRYLKTLHRKADPHAVSTVIVGFHDVNPYTARHMTDYLHILVEEARHAGFSVPEKPFIDRTDELTDAARSRRVQPPPKSNPPTGQETTLSPLPDMLPYRIIRTC